MIARKFPSVITRTNCMNSTNRIQTHIEATEKPTANYMLYCYGSLLVIENLSTIPGRNEENLQVNQHVLKVWTTKEMSYP
jgi:hypothetical protein